MAAGLRGEAGRTREAGRVIERAWATHPHPNLADVYLTLIEDEKPFDRLRRVKGLSARNPGAGESQMALARAALGARDFETAREALEPLLAGEPSQRVCELMGALEGAEDHSPAARVWLARAIHAPADPCWVAEGYQSHAWVAVVPATGAFDALNWQTPISRDGAQAALVPPEPSSVVLPESESTDVAPSDSKTASEADADTPDHGKDESDTPLDETSARDRLPEHVVVAPDDPGPEGSGFEDASGKEENAKW